MTRSFLAVVFIACLAVVSVGHSASAASDTAAPKPKATTLSGKVVETMDGGGYTYVLISAGGEKKWVAAPLMKVTVGQQASFIPGYEMTNFTSKALKRTFDKVYFSAGLVNDKRELGMSEEAIKKSHKNVSPDVMNLAIKKNEDAAAKKGGKDQPAKVGKVTKAKGANAYTVAELFAKRKSLNKKTVVVRGTVVKVSTGIMKRAWVHIQDGTGKAKKKNNELVITSTETPKEGDVVTAKGVLANNKDFGAGYKYDVIIEEAKFSH
ncbi:DNA-binding protein [Geomesophilobacter sediminis]|uniref:DNA-binding protein n=1 Tax=Geomesophilobacter sediminis TaxID=2798584 RepID=A0A8J7LXP4_9BACT|nr:DNA-binding protein [Geomesophilobacter sediminis]MBJ6723466.1 DNA-binding protein [Geomesophilobacter sediminis]